MISTNPDIAITEKLKLVAAVTLGVIHRGVGFLSQCLYVLCIFRVDGDTYTG